MKACTIEECERKQHARGLCSSHYGRLLRHGDPTAGGAQRIVGDDEARFLSYVDQSGECWLWLGKRATNGYGRFALPDREVAAHRWAYEHFVGPIPDRMEIDHVAERGCVHRHCVNPLHLEPVTSSENTARDWANRRRRAA